MKRLTVLRGLPGSGKSTLAREIAASSGAPVFSTDDFFVDEAGVYRFDAGRRPGYHRANIARAAEAMRTGAGHVIVDNVFAKAWEMRPYVEAAGRHGYEVAFLTPATPWARDAGECSRRNRHGVPLATIEAMLAAWDEDVSVAQCLAAEYPESVVSAAAAAAAAATSETAKED